MSRASIEMLRLIVSNGDDVCLVEQNVGGHQNRVLEKAIAHGFLRGRLGLELRHAFEPSHRRDAGEQPGELGGGRNGRLHHDPRGMGIRGNFPRDLPSDVVQSTVPAHAELAWPAHLRHADGMGSNA